jgi:hypothetical protein
MFDMIWSRLSHIAGSLFWLLLGAQTALNLFSQYVLQNSDFKGLFGKKAFKLAIFNL